MSVFKIVIIYDVEGSTWMLVHDVAVEVHNAGISLLSSLEVTNTSSSSSLPRSSIPNLDKNMTKNCSSKVSINDRNFKNGLVV